MHAVEHTLLAAREREYAGPSCPATEHHPHVLQSPVDFTGARTVRRKPLSSIQNVSKPLSFLRSSRACRTLSAADAARSAGLLRLLRTSQRVPNTATVPAPAIATALPRPSMSKTLLPDDDEQTGRLSTTLLEDHRENLLPDDDEQTGRLSTTLLVYNINRAPRSGGRL